LSLNENPFGPSPLALQAIKAHLYDLSRYSGEEVSELTDTIVRREGIHADQIVLGEVLDVLGLYLSANGGPGGEFIYSEPGYTALVNAVAPAGGVVVGVALNEHLENDLPAVAAKVNANTRAIYLINLNPPTNLREVQERMLEISFESRFLLAHADADGSLTEFTRTVEAIMRELPADSPVRQRESFRRLVRFRALKNIKVIEADHAPMTGGMDFSAHGVHARYKSGYAAVDKLLIGATT
jgi:hypothetical protein